MDGSYCVKPLKQKQVVSAHFVGQFIPFENAILSAFHHLFISPSCVSQVDGVSYLLQEIYGIENKYNSQESKVNVR